MKISTCSSRPVLTPCRLPGTDYQLDPYIGCEHLCHYCYALEKAETDWSREIMIHRDIIGQLNRELENIRPQNIYMGYRTDPYQPCEAEVRQTRKVLERFLEKGFSASILTKSDLVLRDTDLLRQMDDASVSVSVAFNSNVIRGHFEAATMDTENRIKALGRLKREGIRTGALICPVVPYITDTTALINALVPVTDAIWIYGLSLTRNSDNPGLRVKKILTRRFPDMAKKIEPIIFSEGHEYWNRLRKELTVLKKDRQLNLKIHV